MELEAQVLHIALQDGFDNEPVVVLINGEEVLRREEVRTDPRIGVAYAFEVPLPEAPVTVEVQLPRRQVSDSVQLEAGGPLHLGVSYQDGALQFKTSAVPFGYV